MVVANGVAFVHQACAKRQRLRGSTDNVGGWYLEEVSGDGTGLN